MHCYTCHPMSIDKLNDDCLLRIFSHLPIVVRIKIERVCKRWQKVSQDAWSTFRTLGLEKSLWGFNQPINDSMLQAVLSRCGQYIIQVDILKSCRSLNRLHLTSNERAIALILGQCPNLRHLKLKRSGLTSSGLSLLTSECCNLTTLSLCIDGNLKEGHLSKLFDTKAKLKSIEVIILKDSGMKGTFMEHFPTNIQEVSLILSETLSIQLSEMFKTFKNLSKICLSNCDIDGLLSVLGTFTKGLKELELLCCRSTTSNTIKGIYKLVNLERLSLKFSTCASDDFLYEVGAYCERITFLDIKGCLDVTDKGISAVASLPNLEHFEIGLMDQVTGKDLKKMSKLRYFKSVDCASFQDDELCHLIKQAPDLNIFKLYGLHKCISNKILKVAVETTRIRTNGLTLNIYFLGCLLQKEIDKFEGKSLLLSLKKLR